jgi:adenylate cyclase
MKSLLFIDDEEGVRRSLAKALKREPYATYTVDTGQEGIAFVKSNLDRVATVISDYKMPGLDGLSTLQAIGRINPEITRIILTGYATMEAAIQATNTGIDGFLTKPFDNKELRAKIHEIWVRKHLRQFVCEQVYAELNKSPAALAPKYHEVTILFSDIRGFTSMSQQADPQSLVDFLNNDYFTPMGDIVHKHKGTLDKHIGDSMMVVFGSPAALGDDALRAVKTAVAMQTKAVELDAALQSHSVFRLRTGIGIASGQVFSGIMGSLRKKEFTSVGMPVNLAARLQSKAAGGEILIDAATYDKVREKIPTEPLPPINVKGVSEPVRVYRVPV